MDAITEAGIQFVADDIKKQFIGDAQFLMKSAIEFIKTIENIINEHRHLENRMKLYNRDTIADLRTRIDRSQTKLKRIIEAQYNFEAQVNAFLGRKINLAWVDIETGAIYFVDEIHANKIYTMASRAAGLSGSIKIQNKDAFINELSQLSSGIQEEYKQVLNRRISSHQGLFMVIMQRFEDNTKQVDNPWYNEHKNTVYWQHPPAGIDGFNHYKWAWSIPTKKGYISQGYINFVVNSVTKLEEVNEFNIGTFMMDFVKPGDRIPGIVKGDVVVDNSSGKVHIAVKSNSFFSTAGLGPYLATAFHIISFYDKLQELTTANVGQFLTNMENYNISMLSKSQDKAKEKIEEIFKQTGAKIF